MTDNDRKRPALLPSLVRWSLVLSAAPALLGLGLAAAPVNLEASYRLLGAWCAVARRVFGLETRIIDHNAGRYDEPPYVFVLLNQTSLCESFVLFEALPRRAVLFANLEFVALPWIGWLTVAQGSVVVVRQWPAQARRAVDRAVRALRSGTSFYISIEGRRSANGALSPYKKGPAILAINSGARIVPIIFRGARDALPFGEWRVRPGLVTVELLPQIDVSDLTLDDRDALVARLRALATEYGVDPARP